MLVTNCGVSRNVAEPGVSQMALMLSVEKKNSARNRKEIEMWEKSKDTIDFFFFNLPCAE